MKRKNLLIVLGTVFIIALVAGGTYAMFSFTGTGGYSNTIKTGILNYSFNEESQSITLEEEYPMAEASGIDREEYFQFQVSATTNMKIDAPYKIFLIEDANNDMDKDFVMVYLTEVQGNEEMLVAGPITFSEATTFTTTNSKTGYIVGTDMLSFDGSTIAETKSKTYRLRAWISSEYTGLDDSGNVLGPKAFKATVNVQAG